MVGGRRGWLRGRSTNGSPWNDPTSRLPPKVARNPREVRSQTRAWADVGRDGFGPADQSGTLDCGLNRRRWHQLPICARAGRAHATTAARLLALPAAVTAAECGLAQWLRRRRRSGQHGAAAAAGWWCCRRLGSGESASPPRRRCRHPRAAASDPRPRCVWMFPRDRRRGPRPCRPPPKQNYEA